MTVALALAAPAGAAACENASATPETASARELTGAAVCLMNRERKRRGLRRLKVDRRLARAAQAHTKDMAEERYFSHFSQAGLTLADRLDEAGYVARARRWRAGENLAWGIGRHGAPRVTVAGWMRRPAHRRNILNRVFREVGVGVVIDDSLAAYTVNFGYRR